MNNQREFERQSAPISIPEGASFDHEDEDDDEETKEDEQISMSRQTSAKATAAAAAPQSTNSFVPHFNAQGIAMTRFEREQIAKRKGLCVNCGIRTYTVTIMTRRPITNESVYKGHCIRCDPTKVPANILQRHKHRYPRTAAPVVAAKSKPVSLASAARTATSMAEARAQDMEELDDSVPIPRCRPLGRLHDGRRRYEDGKDDSSISSSSLSAVSTVVTASRKKSAESINSFEHKAKEQQDKATESSELRKSLKGQPMTILSSPPGFPEGGADKREPSSPEDLRKKLRNVWTSHEDKQLLGVSVYFLAEIFMKEVEAAGYSRNSTIYDMEDLNGPPGLIRQKSSKVICPLDGEVGSSYVHFMEQDVLYRNEVGLASYMLSYTWGYSIGDIVDTLVSFCEQEQLNPRRTYFWICFLCVNQNRIANKQTSYPTTEFFLETFSKRITRIGKVVCMMTPWDDPLYLKRIWCIFEISQAFANDNCTVMVALPPKDKLSLVEKLFMQNSTSVNFKASRSAIIQKALSKIKIQECGASRDSDRLQILSIIKAQDGGYDRTNARVKGQLNQNLHEVLFHLGTQCVEMKRSEVMHISCPGPRGKNAQGAQHRRKKPEPQMQYAPTSKISLQRIPEDQGQVPIIPVETVQCENFATDEPGVVDIEQPNPVMEERDNIQAAQLVGDSRTLGDIGLLIQHGKRLMFIVVVLVIAVLILALVVGFMGVFVTIQSK